MVDVEVAGGQDRSQAGDRLRWVRTVALAFAILFTIVTIAACWMVATQPKAVDFLSYWAAARLALQGDPAMAYDIAEHYRMELTIAPIDGLLPFPYPPPFLLLVTPFGLLPFGIAAAFWILLTGGLYYFAARRLAEPRVVLAQPGVLANGLIGQNGFLIAAIFMAGTRLLERRPFLGGVVLGLFVFKPQLALLLPVAVLAARKWTAIAGAMLTVAILLLAALAAFGVEAYRGFLSTAPQYATFMQQNRWPWEELASTFAFCRSLGLGPVGSMTIHGAVAAVAAPAAWKAWRTDHPAKVAVLAAATMLIPPYLFTYDSLLLVVPIAWLMNHRPNPYLISAVWLCCLLPVAGYFGHYNGPNTIPIAALISLFALWRENSGSVQNSQ